MSSAQQVKATKAKRTKGGFAQSGSVQAYHEGASTGTRLNTRGLRGSGPNAEFERSGRILRTRSRYTLNNHPLGASSANTYVDNLVGNGISAQWENTELQQLWDAWCNECDADGNLNFAGMQALIARGEFSDGEVLVRRRWRRPSDNLAVPMQIELLESDHLPENLSDLTKGIRLGIQKNAIGQRTHYHLYDHHPNDLPNGFGINNTRPVSASDIIHYFQVLRPKQDRGIPHLSAVLLRLYEIDEMQDATLVKQKTAQLFAWIVKKKEQEWSENGAEDGNPDGNADFDEIVEGEAIKKIKAGGVHYLEEDEDIEFSSPDGIGANYSEWLKTELRIVAKAIGLTYEQFTGDLTGVNYSSIRAGLIEFRRRIERLQNHLMIFKLCHKVAQWFLEAVWMNGLVNLKDYSKNSAQYLPRWQTPRWDWVDPLKDVMADILEVRAGFNNREAKNAERGVNYDKNVQQSMKEQGVKTPEELVFDTQPNKVNKAGLLQAGLEILASENQ